MPFRALPGHRPPDAPVRAVREVHCAWICEQVQPRRIAQGIYRHPLERFGFTHRHNSVKRFVRTLPRRENPRFEVLESETGEQAPAREVSVQEFAL